MRRHAPVPRLEAPRTKGARNAEGLEGERDGRRRLRPRGRPEQRRRRLPVGFTEFRQDLDATPLMDGLPDGMCQCPHWGYVLAGKVTFRFADGDETYEAGDAFYTPPGHIPVKH